MNFSARLKTWRKRAQEPVSPHLLGGFRVFFGLLCFFSALRFLLKGWVQELYIQPLHHFHYYGFSWVQLPQNPIWVYGLFGLLMLSCLMVLSGRWYKVSMASFLVLFTYFELIDKSYYLNHYYFISLLAFLMLILPANKALVWGRIRQSSPHSLYFIWALRCFVGAVYFLAGVAKLNADWLGQAQPLKIWLNAYYHWPLVGPWMVSDTMAYAMSYAGCAFDLLVPFALLFSRTRRFAYVVLVLFHLSTALLFPIGVFPYVMCLAALVFFPSAVWQKRIEQCLGITNWLWQDAYKPRARRAFLLVSFLFFHFLFPFRYLLYPGHVMWHEQGFRFSWRVMLMEKNGYAEFEIEDEDGRVYAVVNTNYLTPLQEKMMCTQPDFMLEYAQILKEDFEKQGISVRECRSDAWVSLNGRKPFRMIQNNVNLLAEKDGFASYNWLNYWDDQE